MTRRITPQKPEAAKYFAASVVCYICSFVLPTLDAGDWNIKLGYLAFLFAFTELRDIGSFELKHLLPSTAWMANPLYWFSILAFALRQYKLQQGLAVCCIVTASIGSLSFMMDMWYLPGFWVWLASFGVIMYAGRIASRSQRERE